MGLSLAVFLGITFIFVCGVGMGFTIWGDHMAERGRYVMAAYDNVSGWVHGDTLFLPLWYVIRKTTPPPQPPYDWEKEGQFVGPR